MINYAKIQGDIIKKLIKGEKVHCAEGEKDIYITHDGFALYVIPKNIFFLDVSKIEENKSFIKIVDNFLYAKPVKIANEIKVIAKKVKAVKFQTEDGTDVYLNEKFIEMCDKWNYYRNTFYGTCNDVLTVIAVGIKVK